MSSTTLPAPVGTNQELRTRQAVACMTSTTDHVEAKHGHHELVCELRDVRAETHLSLCSTCTADCRRNGERCVGAGSSQASIPGNLCAMISTMLTTALRDTLVPKFALVSTAHLQDHVDASGNSARHSGAVRSSARCWLVSGPDAGHHASTRSATMSG